MRYLGLIGLFCFGLLPVAQGQTTAVKQIALTFDDAPRPDQFLSSEDRTDQLLAALADVGVAQVMFFVTGKHLRERPEAMTKYQNAGHLVANHSDQHLWLHKTPVVNYQIDLIQAHEQLKRFENFRPYFRFPYLDEGRDRESHEAMREFLLNQGYQNGYVTVDNYDWYLEKLFQDAKKAGQKVDMASMRQLYIDVLWGAIQFYDEIAVTHLGRSPKHVLLLHDNDLAAMFIDDLVLFLRGQGWEIIGPEEAYTDPIAKQVPNTLFNGQGRVAALARDQGVAYDALIHPAESEAVLEDMFQQVIAEPVSQTVD